MRNQAVKENMNWMVKTLSCIPFHFDTKHSIDLVFSLIPFSLFFFSLTKFSLSFNSYGSSSCDMFGKSKHNGIEVCLIE